MPTEAGAPGGPARAASAPVRRSRRGLIIAGVAAGVLALLVVASGLLSRAHDAAQLKTWTRAQAIPAVSTISASADAGGRALVLPGNLQAFYNAPIYSRVSGYVHRWRQDIGAHVHSGELLATIETPELDQQIEQARADIASAQANVQLAATTAQRWSKLLSQDAVSKQETDEKLGDLAVKTAQLNSAKANLGRLLAMKGFARITAPFDGVITARKTDIGALVNAGASATANSELFDVAKIDKLRLYVHVPQNQSAQIRPGETVTLTVPEYPGRTFPAVLSATSNAVSDSSGTLLVELLVANADEALKAGDYAQVAFQLPGGAGASTLLLPTSAVLFRNKGTEVAVVGPDSRARMRSVTIGRDLGESVEITSGISQSDTVIDNPPDSILDGELVRVTASARAQPARTVNAAD
ncbi:MAG TPA: efflux RND transporter periplasmic adaptor subunit [Caulobacteraceae bacterium]|jgi:RND family efflux transporter MFP subunit|nr:efflux RND transporter periplasmic adaptor subunit [Caulobacteraceae bacterium]